MTHIVPTSLQAESLVPLRVGAGFTAERAMPEFRRGHEGSR